MSAEGLTPEHEVPTGELNDVERSKDPSLTAKEVFATNGCGAGEDLACFAISQTSEGFECLNIAGGAAFSAAGIRLGWRVNEDKNGSPQCPKGVLLGSQAVSLDELEVPEELRGAVSAYDGDA